jgi:hypothetical protein
MLTSALSAVWLFPSQRDVQMVLLITTAVLYVFWGVIHHVIHHRFSLHILLEYIAVGVLGISILLFVASLSL